MKLLVMEDEIRFADILSDWFQKKGFAVTVCMTAFRVMKKRRMKFDVILSDVMLPGLDGFQLVRKLREKKIAAPVLFLTARVELPREICRFCSMNLQIAWLNSGTDAKLEWQWDGGHVPSEISANPWRSTSMRCMENTWKEQQRSRRQPGKTDSQRGRRRGFRN